MLFISNGGNPPVPVEYPPTAIQVASLPEPIQLVELKKPTVGNVLEVTADQVCPPSVLCANNGCLIVPIQYRPAAVQNAVLPVPEQFTELKFPLLGILLTGSIDQVRPPLLLRRMMAGEALLSKVLLPPTAKQMAFAPLPEQYAEESEPSCGKLFPVTDDHVAPPFFVSSRNNWLYWG